MGTKKQASVSVTGEMEKVLSEAHKVFGEEETDAKVYRKALINWYDNRKYTSRREAIERSDQNQAQLIAEYKQIGARIAALEQTVAEIRKKIGGV